METFFILGPFSCKSRYGFSSSRHCKSQTLRSS